MKFLSFCFLPFLLKKKTADFLTNGTVVHIEDLELTPLESLLEQSNSIEEIKRYTNREFSPIDRLYEEILNLPNFEKTESLNTFLIISFLYSFYLKKKKRRSIKQIESNQKVSFVFFIISFWINFTRNIHPVL